MSCPTEIEIPNLTEPCENLYLSTSCIFIPEANVTLDLPANATQTEVNDALTAALVYKEQQIQQMENTIDLLDGSRVDIFVEGDLNIDGTGTEDEPFIIGTTFDIADYQVKNIPDNLEAASALNEGRLRYRKDANNSYVDMSMQIGVGTYAWQNIMSNNWI